LAGHSASPCAHDRDAAYRRARPEKLLGHTLKKNILKPHLLVDRLHDSIRGKGGVTMTRITKSDPWACLWRSLFRPGGFERSAGPSSARGKVHTLDGELYAESLVLVDVHLRARCPCDPNTLEGIGIDRWLSRRCHLGEAAQLLSQRTLAGMTQKHLAAALDVNARAVRFREGKHDRRPLRNSVSPGDALPPRRTCWTRR
jgi:hypothetical protein